MSRSGYSEDEWDWHAIMYRGAVASSIRGKAGQRFLRELRDALQAMAVKELHPNVFSVDGCHCALGVLGNVRGTDLSELNATDPYDIEASLVGKTFGIPKSLAAEIMYVNDECGLYQESPVGRYARVMEWLRENIKEGHQ